MEGGLVVVCVERTLSFGFFGEKSPAHAELSTTFFLRDLRRPPIVALMVAVKREERLLHIPFSYERGLPRSEKRRARL